MSFLTQISQELEAISTSDHISQMVLVKVISVPIPVFPAAWFESSGLRILTLHISRTNGPRSQGFEPCVVPIDRPLRAHRLNPA